jgi:murein DD-endopeptidase MepM/ murein hydrolase activator NlpD
MEDNESAKTSTNDSSDTTSESKNDRDQTSNSSSNDSNSGLGHLDSSKYSLGVDTSASGDSNSDKTSSRYSLGVDTNPSGGSKSQADRTETEKSYRNNLSRSESWNSRFSLDLDKNLGIETKTSYSRYSLDIDKSLGISPESLSSRFSLGVFESPSPTFPLETGNKNSNGDKPVEKLQATPKDSNTSSKSSQQPSSTAKSNNSTNVTDKIKAFIHDIKEQLKGYANDAFKIFDSDADEKKTKQGVNTKQQGASPQKSLLTNPVPGGQVGSGFGFRQDPLKKTTANKMHWGLDIKAPTGTLVQSAGDGKATVMTNHKDYGNFVVIDHGNGLQTSYAHMDSVSIKNGESVKQGQEIGKVGNTGRSTGPHLHFEVRSGDNRGASFHSKSDKENYYKDPKDYINFGK